MGEIFERTVPRTTLPWTGERLTTGVTGQVEIEHLHRYAFARDLCRGLDVLDIASGEGYGSALVAQVAQCVIGVEIDPAAVAHAQAAYRRPNLRFLQGDARAIPLLDASVDAVVSFETIEHLYEHDTFISEIRRVLRAGGRLIISSPERDMYSPVNQEPNPYHVRELTRREFTRLLRRVFPYVALFAQRPFLGAALVAEEAVGRPLLTFERRGETHFEASLGLPRPLYWVAIASDVPVPTAAAVLYIDTPDVESIYARLRAASVEAPHLRQQLETLQVQAEDWRQQLERLQPQAEDWRQGVLQRSSDIADLQQRLAQQQHLTTIGEAERAELDATLSALKAEAGRLQETAAGQAETLQTRLLEALDRAADVERHLFEVYSSTSWRLTGPFRGFVLRHPTLVDGFRRRAIFNLIADRPTVAMLRALWRLATLRSPIPVFSKSSPVSAELVEPPVLPLASPTNLAGSAPRTWFFLGDTVEWLATHSQVTGVGRVTAELFFASLNTEGATPIPCALAPNPEGLASLAVRDSAAFLAARTGQHDVINLLEPPGQPIRPPAIAFAPIREDNVLFTGVVWTPVYAALFERLAAQGIRFSVMLYDIIPVENPEYVSEAHRTAFTGWLRTTLTLANIIFVSSAENRDKLLRWAVLAEAPLKASVVPVTFGADRPRPASFSGQLPRALAATRVRTGGFVLSVGTIDKRKNQAALCRLWPQVWAALPAHQAPQLVLVGRDDLGLETVSHEVAALIDAGNIMMLQGVTDVELSELYYACLFTAFPSLSEGYGLPVAESLAHGKVCIASDLAVIRDHAGDLPWYVPPGDDAALLQAMLTAIVDTAARAEAEDRITRHYAPKEWTETWRVMRDAMTTNLPSTSGPGSCVPNRPDIPGIARVAVEETLRRAQRWCTETAPEVSILIVNWNAADLTMECIRQIWANTEDLRYEILVADNGSDPASLPALRQLGRGIRLLELGVNRYFGEANNIAAEQAQGRLLLLLNNDAFVQAGTLRALVGALNSDPRAGAAGPLFLFPDGTIQEAGGSIDARGYPVRAERGKRMATRELSPRVVDYISAATLLVRKECFLRAGGFDLAYEPAYYEDADLCLKLRALHRPVLFCPEAQVIHIEGAAAKGDPAAEARRNALGDLNRDKFTARWSPFLESRGDEKALQQIAERVLPVPTPTPAVIPGATTAALFTPYVLTAGGGERFLLTIAAALSRDHETTIVTPHPYSRLRLLDLARELSIDLGRCHLATEAEFLSGPAPNRMVTMGNHIVPPIPSRAKDGVFICQFPFPLAADAVDVARDRAKSYSLVITYSDYARAHVLAGLSTHQMPPWQVEVVYPPVPQYLGDAGNKRRAVLTVGRFFVGGHHKRHDLMIDAFARLLQRTRPDLEMHVVGSSMPNAVHMDYLVQLRNQAKNLPVTFHVNASRERLAELYRDAALYWHATGLGAPLAEYPGAAEHFGISVLEAMSAGCVPMAFNSGGPREIVTHGVDGWLYNTLDDLVGGAADLLAPERDETRQAMGRAAVRRAASFAPEAFQERVRQLLLG